MKSIKTLKQLNLENVPEMPKKVDLDTQPIVFLPPPNAHIVQQSQPAQPVQQTQPVQPEQKPKRKLNLSEQERERRRENMNKLRMRKLEPKKDLIEEFVTPQPPKPVKEKKNKDDYNIVYKDIDMSKIGQGNIRTEDYIKALVDAKVAKTLYKQELTKKQTKKGQKNIDIIENKLDTNIKKTEETIKNNERLVKRLIPMVENGRQVFKPMMVKEFI